MILPSANPDDIVISDQLKNDITCELNARYLDLAKSPGYQLLLTNPSLSNFCHVVVILIILGYSGLLVYGQVIQWQDFDETDKYIDNQCPWGVIYILMTLLVYFIQGPGYNFYDQKFKDIQAILENDVHNINDLIFSPEEFKDVSSDVATIILSVSLLVIQYFSQTFLDAALNIVALDFLGQLQLAIRQKIFILITTYKSSNLRIFQKIKTFCYSQYQHKWFNGQKSFNSIYLFFWDIKKLNNTNFLPFPTNEMNQNDCFDDEDNNNLKLINALYIKIHDKYCDLVNQPGYKYLALGYQLRSVRRVKLLILSGINLVLVGIIISKYFQIGVQQEYIGDTNIPNGVLFILISLPIILIQGAGKAFVNQTEETLCNLIKDYKYLCEISNIDSKPFLFPIEIFNFVSNCTKFQEVVVIIVLIILAYLSQSFNEAILNLCALEFIGSLNSNNKIMIFKIEDIEEIYSNIKKQFCKIWNLSCLSKIQICNLVLELGKNPEELKNDENNEELNEIQLKDMIYDKLKQLFEEEIPQEEGYQYPLMAITASFGFRYITFSIQMTILTLIMITTIDQWLQQSDSEKYINDSSFPWGVLYAYCSAYIIKEQGLGQSENTYSIDNYRLLRNIYREICKKHKKPLKFEWNDQDLRQIELFNLFQLGILGGCLLAIQFFSLSFYQAIINIVSLEFLYKLDEHGLAKALRYNIHILILYEEWNDYNIWNLKGEGPEAIFRYVWEKNKDEEKKQVNPINNQNEELLMMVED